MESDAGRSFHGILVGLSFNCRAFVIDMLLGMPSSRSSPTVDDLAILCEQTLGGSAVCWLAFKVDEAVRLSDGRLIYTDAKAPPGHLLN